MIGGWLFYAFARIDGRNGSVSSVITDLIEWPLSALGGLTSSADGMSSSRRKQTFDRSHEGDLNRPITDLSGHPGTWFAIGLHAKLVSMTVELAIGSRGV
jgi:hypothetical protein